MADVVSEDDKLAGREERRVQQLRSSVLQLLMIQLLLLQLCGGAAGVTVLRSGGVAVDLSNSGLFGVRVEPRLGKLLRRSAEASWRPGNC